MLSYLLFRQIVILFIIMFCGVLLVKLGFLKRSDQRALVMVLINVAVPCLAINAFLKVDPSPEVRNGLLLTAAATAVIHILMILLARLVKKPLRLQDIEEVSIVYSNSGALMVPLVTAILGGEWVVYSVTFFCVQNLLLWTHAISMVSGERQFAVKKLITNPNIVAIILGAVLFLTQIRPPEILCETMDAMGATVGPLTMISTGMIMAEADFKKIFSNIRIYLIIFLKLIVTPLICIALLRLFPADAILPNGREILLVTAMTMAAPTANLLTQWSALYNKDADYAGAICVATTLLCIVTMPLMVFVYQL